MSEETIKCLKCGTENKKTDKFCGECGEKLNNITTEEKAKKIFKRKYVTEFLSVVELITFLITTFIISAVIVFLSPNILKDASSGDNTVFGQLYSSILTSFQGTSILTAIVFVFIIFGIFKFNRIEKRIIETQDLIEKYIINSQNFNVATQKYDEDDDTTKADFMLYIIGVIALMAFGIFALMYKFG